MTSERPDDLDELQALFETLHTDDHRLLQQIDEADDQALRRSAIRTVFAFIEGVVFSLKQVALNFEPPGSVQFVRRIVRNVGYSEVRQ